MVQGKKNARVSRQPTIDNGKDRNDTIELLVNSTVLRRPGILAHQVNDFHCQI